MVKKQTKNENSSKLLARAAEVWNERALGFITEMNLQIERSALDGVQLRMPYNPEF